MEALNQLEMMQRYARQISLKEIGLAGQEKLRAAKVVVVGAGGLGCPALQYLVGAGVGQVTIIDGDTVERSNLHRQILFGEEDVGKLKSATAASRLRSLNPQVVIQCHTSHLSVENALAYLEGADIVLDGSDNFPARYLVNDACVKLGMPFIAASIFGFEGQLAVFNYHGSATYRCLYPEPPPPELVPNCAENGVLGAVPGLFGTLQASECLKLILELDAALIGKLLLFNLLTLHLRVLKIRASEEVISKVKESALGTLPGYEEINCKRGSLVQIITPPQLKAKLDAHEDLQLIDVREPYEKEIADLGGELIPLKDIGAQGAKIDRTKPVVVYCRSGGRSQQACALLERSFGLKNLYNLEGGILAWADLVDPSMVKY